MRWRIALLISAAIAISYLDRQTLPVAIKAIGKDIPLSNEQFSTLQSAFLLAYGVMYAAGGKLMNEQQMSDLNTQLVLARARTSEAEARLNRIRHFVQPRGAFADSEPAPLSSQGVAGRAYRVVD